MPQQTAMIDSLPEAFEMVKAMRSDGLDCGAACRLPAGGAAGPCRDHPRRDGRGCRPLALRPRRPGTDATAATEPARAAFCANSATSNWIRLYRPTAVLGSYARRTREIDRVILAGFVLGLPTRRIGEVLLPPPGPAHHRQPRG